MKKLVLFLLLFATFLCPNLTSVAHAQNWSIWTSMGGGLYWRIQKTSQWKMTFTGIRYEYWNWQFRNATDNTINFDYGVDTAPGAIINRWYVALPPRASSQILGDFFLPTPTLYARWRMPSVLGPNAGGGTTTPVPSTRESPTNTTPRTTASGTISGPMGAFGPATIVDPAETASSFSPELQSHYYSFRVSPDGKKIAFLVQQNSRHYLCIANVDGTQMETLAWAKNLRADNDSYCFSPDGTRIAFANTEGTNSEIVVINIATGTAKTVTTSKSTNLSPSFSPDGSKLTFTSSRDGNMMEAYIVNSDGTELRRLTNHMSSVRFPIFTPDGNSIAYLFKGLRPTEQMSIHLMRIDGTSSTVLGVHNVAPQPVGFALEMREIHPGFSVPRIFPAQSRLIMSPDGTKFAFTYYNGRNTELFIANRYSTPKHIIQQDTTEKSEEQTSQYNPMQARSVPQIEPQFSPDGNRILYVSRHDGNDELYSVGADGSELERLTINADSDHTARYSRDGSKITYISTSIIPSTEEQPEETFVGDVAMDVLFRRPIRTKSNVYVMNADGSEVRQLTNDLSSTEPTFAAKDSKIAFLSSRLGSRQIYTMSIDGKQQRTLINAFSLISQPDISVVQGILPDIDSSTLREAVFSRDGSKIAFVSIINGNSEISLMNTDGSGVQRLTNNTADDKSPSFSPDGTKLVFSSTRDSEKNQGPRNSEIYIMNVDGSEPTRLTNDVYASSITPTFNSDGTKVAFVTSMVGNTEIHVMNADDTAPKRLTTNAGPDISPIFSPDGTQIAFISHRDNQTDLYQMNADGTELRRITNDAKSEASPVFNGTGTRLAYITDNNGISVLSLGGTTNQIATLHVSVPNSTPSFLTFNKDGSKLAFLRRNINSIKVHMVPIGDLTTRASEVDLPPVHQAFALSYGQGDTLGLFAAIGGQMNITKLTTPALKPS